MYASTAAKGHDDVGRLPLVGDMCGTRCPRARDSLRNCLTTSASTYASGLLARVESWREPGKEARAAAAGLGREARRRRVELQEHGWECVHGNGERSRGESAEGRPRRLRTRLRPWLWTRRSLRVWKPCEIRKLASSAGQGVAWATAVGAGELRADSRGFFAIVDWGPVWGSFAIR